MFIENAPDITRNSTHYENVDKYGYPSWTKTMVKTIKIGSHTFFREKDLCKRKFVQNVNKKK